MVALVPPVTRGQLCYARRSRAVREYDVRVASVSHGFCASFVTVTL
jgi:hypothetical protein